MKNEKRLLWGYIDRTGGWVAEPEYDYLGEFHEGRFAIPPAFAQAEPFSEGLGRVRASARARWQYITRAGVAAFKGRYVQAEPFCDGLARVLTEL